MVPFTVADDCEFYARPLTPVAEASFMSSEVTYQHRARGRALQACYGAERAIRNAHAARFAYSFYDVPVSDVVNLVDPTQVRTQYARTRKPHFLRVTLCHNNLYWIT